MFTYYRTFSYAQVSDEDYLVCNECGHMKTMPWNIMKDQSWRCLEHNIILIRIIDVFLCSNWRYEGQSFPSSCWMCMVKGRSTLVENKWFRLRFFWSDRSVVVKQLHICFYGLTTKMLRIWGRVIYHWKGLENTSPTVYYIPINI
jgi:hypothetical protein